jgi:hypothetical protein
MACTLRQQIVDTFCITFIINIFQTVHIRIMNITAVGTSLGQLPAKITLGTVKFILMCNLYTKDKHRVTHPSCAIPRTKLEHDMYHEMCKCVQTLNAYDYVATTMQENDHTLLKRK